MKDVDIEIFYENNNKLKNIWLNFEEHVNNTPFQSYSWFDIWIKYAEEKKLGDFFIFVISDFNNETLAIFPLIRRKNFLIKKLELIGDKKAEYKLPLIKETINEKTQKKIWNLIFNNLPPHDYFVIDRYPINLIGRLINFDLRKVGFSQFFFEPAMSTEKYCDLKTMMMNISKNNKRNIKNKEKLIKLGKYKFSIITSKNDYFLVLNQIATAMEKKLDKLGITNKSEIHENTSFYKLFWNIKNEKNSIKPLLVGLYFNEELLAASWSLLYKNCLYYIFGGLINSHMQNYTPGTLMQYELINYAYQNDCKIIDFTLGDEIYKFRWGSKINKLIGYIRFNTIKGRIFALYFILLYKIKSIKSIKKLYRNTKKFIRISSMKNI